MNQRINGPEWDRENEQWTVKITYDPPQTTYCFKTEYEARKFYTIARQDLATADRYYHRQPDPAHFR